MWLYDDYHLPHAKELALPTGTTTLVINLALREATLCGAHAKPFVLETKRMISHLGVHFHPGGLAPFLDLPANELQNQVLTLDLLWGNSVFGLRDQLLAAGTPMTKFRLVERVLLGKLTQAPQPHPAVAYALEQFQCRQTVQTVSTVTDHIGLSDRRFRQLFQERVGLSPKRFLRIQRFQQVLKQVEQETTVDWADIAVTHGYFDQAHLIHDFQTFAGIAPTVYLANSGRHRNHVSIQQ